MADTERPPAEIRPPTNIEDTVAERWLHRQFRGYRDVLIGTAVCCVGCGRLLGATTVAFPPDWVEPPEPEWPFGMEWCPVCGGTEPERLKREDIERRLEEQRQRKLHDPKRLP